MNNKNENAMMSAFADIASKGWSTLEWPDFEAGWQACCEWRDSQVGEPVAWMCSNSEYISRGYSKFSKECFDDWDIPLYTAPPAAQINQQMLNAIEAAINCGMVPTSSAKEGGAAKHSIQVHVADQLREALACAKGQK